MMAQNAPDDSEHRAQAPGKGRRGWLLVGGALVLAGGLIWLSRTHIADTLVADQLDERGVNARYIIESIGPRTQRIANVVIGDAANPDLVARWVELDIGWTWSGPVVAAIRADGVRLKGKWDQGRLSLGEVDKLLPPPSDEPIAIPDWSVRLTDARARIDTPWGPVGISANGAGRLRGGFSGEMALIGEGLAVGDCSAQRISAFGKVAVEAGQPRFIGPVRAAEVACSDAGVKLARFDTRLDASLSADFRKVEGAFDATASQIGAAGGRLAAANAKGRFNGSADASQIDFDAAAREMAFAGMTARAFMAKGGLTLVKGQPAGEARVSFAGAQVPQEWRTQFKIWSRSDQAAPLGDLFAVLGAAGSRALDTLSGQAAVRLVGDVRTPRIEVAGPSLQSAGGARLVAGGDSVISTELRNMARWSAQGSWTLSGGGLPQTAIRIDRSPLGRLRADLRVAPLAGRTSRLALSPVMISGQAGRPFQIITQATFSGVIAGGRVTGLAVPVNAMIGTEGSIRLAGGCNRLTLMEASFAGVDLGPNALQLCAAKGEPLLSYSGGRLGGTMALVAPRLTGRTGENPLALSASGGSYSLASGNWSLDNLAVAVGESDAASNFAALRIEGGQDDGVWAGIIREASGEIGTIPLDLQEIAGNWRYQNAALTLAGAIKVTDQSVPDRFNPLVSEDVAFEFSDGRIAVTANFKEAETGSGVGRVDLRHDFGDAVGSADLIISALQFGPKFQPEQLSPLALGVIANADARVTGQGRIDWRGDTVTSSGRFTADASRFAAAFGTVAGAKATIEFDDLLAMHSPPGQVISMDEINPGFPVLGGEIAYQLLDANRIHIEGGRWPFAGGELRLHPTTLDFDVNAVRRLEFELTGVDAAVFLTELGFDNINASGVFDGILPVEFSGLGGRIVGGRLSARPGGGEVAYVGELSNYNLGTMANFAFNMLKSLRYEQMDITLDGDLDGEMLTDVQFKGLRQGSGASRNIITRQIEKLPIIFNVRINAPFRELIGSAKSLYDPTDLLRQRLPALIEAQRQQQNILVQPSESDKVP